MKKDEETYPKGVNKKAFINLNERFSYAIKTKKRLVIFDKPFLI